MAGDFPDGFFERTDDGADSQFYAQPRLVTHIDDNAIAAVGVLYDELAVNGRVLDLMSSWISHFTAAPSHLTVLGMNEVELAANPQASDRLVHDLNADPVLPFDDASFDDAVCAVSVDYLTRPLEVFAELARVIKPGGRFITTFSNRMFPTKAIRGWLANDDRGHCAIVARYFETTPGWDAPSIEVRVPHGYGNDPLYAVWATRSTP